MAGRTAIPVVSLLAAASHVGVQSCEAGTRQSSNLATAATSTFIICGVTLGVDISLDGPGPPLALPRLEP